MVGHGTKYSRKKEAAIAALLEQRNVQEAARAAGISTQTLYRWLRMPEFVEEYRRARRIVLEQAYARTQQNAALAVSVLMKLMVDSLTPASGRIRAALGLFSLARQGWDLGTENRVSPLERGKRIIIPSLRDASDEELAALLASAEQRPATEPIE
jgi:transposase-like protein